MYITTRYSGETTHGVQLNAEDWLNSVYGIAPLPDAVTTQVQHSHNFYHTRTYTGGIEYPDVIRDVHRGAIERCVGYIDTLRAEHPEPLTDMYTTFYMAKANGGQRRIDAPKDFLKEVMDQIKAEFERVLQVQYHDTCYSYFPGRGTKDALMVHQRNESKWFAKFDMKNFFPNTTKEFLLRQLTQLHPFAELYEYPVVAPAINQILDLCMYDNGLPQGTPLSPMLTNLMMIPLDFKLTRMCYDHENRLVYTRYADDILISSKYNFNHEAVQDSIVGILNTEETPFTINHEKTRYGSAAGSNWNLGLMLNKDNNITIGHRRKQMIRAAINNFLRDFTRQQVWATIRVQTMLGELSYLRNVEPDYADYIVEELECKYHTNFRAAVKTVLNTVEPPITVE